jgi:hypothetical protein
MLGLGMKRNKIVLINKSLILFVLVQKIKYECNESILAGAKKVAEIFFWTLYINIKSNVLAFFKK